MNLSLSDGINAKDTEELQLLAELSITSVSDVRPFHRHLFIHTVEELLLPESWSHRHDPELVWTTTTLLISLSPGQSMPDEDMPPGRVWVLFLSVNAVLLHHFLLWYANRAKQNCSCSWWEKICVCVEIMNLINKPAQWLLRHKRTLHERTPSHGPYEAAVIILVKRFKLRKGKIGAEAS